MTMRPHNLVLSLALVGLASPGLLGCAEEQPNTNVRGMGNKSKGGAGTRRSGSGDAMGAAQGEAPQEENTRPRPELTRDDFTGRSRDPFHNYLAAEVVEAPVPIEEPKAQRSVKLREYGFDELRLIAIVNAGRNVSPTALFLAGRDNKSKGIKQGEYFSSQELLLASVNRDYIEVEIVDPELTPGWNLDRGERKVIYLKNR
ncbi:hypothetical protein PPSIR1_35447 [Plesiocystis pacifica SIR-1]|uniref:Lipoprotein n=1 Tax=Plesiocystis pacifica SIR-1 TaxID=391625 RepID=A6GHB6_9BACT|nr:hypothetical protein [Plesiocystis pacifica]EDM74731.1 hypothetical protein PPSIR1_35447 [Plesiocystis pacifica SIR-1]